MGDFHIISPLAHKLYSSIFNTASAFKGTLSYNVGIGISFPILTLSEITSGEGRLKLID